MLKRWIENIKFTASNDDTDVRRKNTRRKTDTAVAVINNCTFSVENWSRGGMLLVSRNNRLEPQQDINATLKFKIGDHVMEMEQQGTVVRTGFNSYAVQFKKLSDQTASGFQHIIDDAVAREFAESQIA